MTQTQIVQTLKLHHSTVNNAIKQAAQKFPDILKRFVNGNLWCGTEFSLEETKEIYRQLNRNELEIILLEENWKEPSKTDVYTIKGTMDFLDRFAENPNIKCCNTCKYLKGKVTGSSMPKPFCSVYQRYLESFNAKVYEDYCSSYDYIKLPKPRQWFKDNAPRNLNNYGETDTVNGIKTSDLQVQRKSDEPIRHVGQIGF